MEFNESFWKLKKSIDELVGYETIAKAMPSPYHARLDVVSNNGTLLGFFDLYQKADDSWNFGGTGGFVPNIWSKLCALNGN